MPYIVDSEWKSHTDMAIDDFDGASGETYGWVPLSHVKAGPLNYLITRLVLRWIGSNPSYERLNGAIGVLECAKQELYRRVVAPYEDAKREENGDVY